MKIQKNNLSKLIVAISFLGTLLMTTACNDSEGQTKSNSVSKTNVKPPSIDIHTAIITNNIEALKQHIAAGSNLNEKDPLGGSSPLISACLFDKPEMAKMLINAGADLNFQNNDGSTALITAAFFCHPEIVKILLVKGANKMIKNKYGSTAYESVSAPFDQVRSTYENLGKMLAPMGLKMDLGYIEKTRPQIAAMLK